MRCDIDTRLWASPEQLGGDLAGDLRRRRAERVTLLDANEEAHGEATTDCDRAVVAAFRSALLGVDLGNDFVAAAARRRPDRLVPFAGIDPLLPSWEADLERALERGHLGICVHPASQGFSPTHGAAMRLWERCAERKLPVLVSPPLPLPFPLARRAMLEFAAPVLWDEPLRQIDGLTLVIAGLGSPFENETMALLAKHERAFAHIAGLSREPMSLYLTLRNAADRGIAGRLLFASGFPADTPAQVTARLFSLSIASSGASLPLIPRKELAAIIERDVFAALGIPDPVPNRPQNDEQALLAAARALLAERDAASLPSSSATSGAVTSGRPAGS